MLALTFHWLPWLGVGHLMRDRATSMLEGHHHYDNSKENIQLRMGYQQSLVHTRVHMLCGLPLFLVPPLACP